MRSACADARRFIVFAAIRSTTRLSSLSAQAPLIVPLVSLATLLWVAIRCSGMGAGWLHAGNAPLARTMPPQRPHPAGDGPPDLVRRIFLDEDGPPRLSPRSAPRHPRTRLTSVSLVRIAPCSAFRNNNVRPQPVCVFSRDRILEVLSHQLESERREVGKAQLALGSRHNEVSQLRERALVKMSYALNTMERLGSCCSRSRYRFSRTMSSKLYRFWQLHTHPIWQLNLKMSRHGLQQTATPKSCATKCDFNVS